MNKALKILIPLIMVAVIIASIGWYLFVYDRDFTRDMLIGQARYHNDKSNPELASWFYGLAYSFTEQDEEIAIELANQYKNDGNYTKAEYTLTNAIADGGTAELYIALCKTYVEQDKLLDAVNMLNSIGNAAIKAELDALRPAPVQASPAPGFYSEYISAELSSAEGSIYFSLDQEYPSIHGSTYGQPIALDVGQTVIQAVAVADNGLVSPLSELSFTVGGIVEEVKFTDDAFQAQIRSLLGVDEDDVIMTNALWDIKEFTVSEEARSVEDLKYLPYLEQLTMKNRKLVNLDILTNLTSLQSVDLSGCRFPAEALSILAELPQLRRLNLNDCGLSTVAALTGVKTLTHLYLSGNTLRNLSSISHFYSLVELTLDHNAMVDLTALSALVNLEKLDVSHNSLTSFAPLATCTKLTWLNAGNNSISALDTLDKLPKLQHLDLDSNQLSDISLLGSCAALTELNIAKNQIVDISMLSSLDALDTFNFSYNQVKTLPSWSSSCKLRTIDGSHNQVESIEPLAKMSELSYVYMDYNKLKSVDSIAKCYHLVMVNVYGNEIKDVSALTEHDIIVNYDPT